jgi:hypothetical protein
MKPRGRCVDQLVMTLPCRRVAASSRPSGRGGSLVFLVLVLGLTLLLLLDDGFRLVRGGLR